MPEIRCEYDKLVNIKELKPHPKNPNKHSPEQIERLAKLIDYQGIRHPIIVSNLSGNIVAGHGRWAALKKLKAKEVPIDYQDFASEEMEYAFLTSDNAIQEWAELDLASIQAEAEALVGKLDLELLGLKDPLAEVEQLEPQCDEDEVPETAPAVSVLGDLYELGEHRLLCGDSTSIDSVEKLMNGEKADMVFTDPPYRVAFKGQRFSSTTIDGKKVHGDYSANNKYDAIKNDNLSEEDFNKFITTVCSNLFLSLKAEHAWYICFAQSELHLLLNGIISAGSKWKNIIIWMKNQANLSNMDYKSRYEPIVYSQSGGRFFGERYKTEDIWEIQRTLKNDLHPTMKPIPLIENAILNSSETSNIVIDFFGGSGSTLIACEKTKRKCFMMELDPHYVDVIVTRWCKYTGQTKVKRNGEEIEWKVNG